MTRFEDEITICKLIIKEKAKHKEHVRRMDRNSYIIKCFSWNLEVRVRVPVQVQIFLLKDLEVRIRVPVKAQIFILKFDNLNV